MATKVVTGVPGSGKSYYVVREIIAKNYEWEKEFDEWKMKKDIKPFTLFTNIDGLRLPHINLEKYWDEKGIDYRQFFTVSYQEKVVEKYGRVIIVLDEAQKYFPSDFRESKDIGGGKNPEQSCFYLFEWHRHLGLDIYLMAQRWTRLHKDIVGLAEYQIEAVRRTLSLAGEFRYQFLNGSDVLSHKTIKPDKKIFALYQSMKHEEHGKQIRPLHKFLAIAACLALVTVGMFAYALNTFFGSGYVKNFHSEVESTNAVTEKKPDRKTLAKKPTAASVGGGRRAGFSPKVVRVAGGGIWQGSVLLYVQVLGELYRVDELPYSYETRFGRIYVHVPADEYQAQMQDTEEVKDSEKRKNDSGSRYAT